MYYIGLRAGNVESDEGARLPSVRVRARLLGG